MENPGKRKGSPATVGCATTQSTNCDLQAAAQPGPLPLKPQGGRAFETTWRSWMQGGLREHDFGASTTHVCMYTLASCTCRCCCRLGVEFVKQPDGGSMKGLAFIKDPGVPAWLSCCGSADGSYFNISGASDDSLADQWIPLNLPCTWVVLVHQPSSGTEKPRCRLAAPLTQGCQRKLHMQ